ncbi:MULTISPECIES: hypothetical protein [Flavobacterium]|uniref:Uncharacterized protein n=1 Tax=Flavobacterium columnare TaxID=996 RepID=A0AA94EWY5_9FLAO|nr:MULTISPECIES: hypothetical protein [Flavobacterium]MCH4828240.1 hypothetical protein [Flavobacterium columnare]MCH4828911.1 hypothetical protein [Flavobacterium columnare]MCH4829807.1 hypothetical protein [Flavobacterium columnare]MCH4831636.1 hypothetical protein [Flavobacterium columnare]MCH4831673.1 hypothetical protein [Flavobacterium columnare]
MKTAILNYYIDENGRKQPIYGNSCDHKNTHIRVINNIVTCETTIVVCDDCKITVTEPITDCR